MKNFKEISAQVYKLISLLKGENENQETTKEELSENLGIINKLDSYHLKVSELNKEGKPYLLTGSFLIQGRHDFVNGQVCAIEIMGLKLLFDLETFRPGFIATMETYFQLSGSDLLYFEERHNYDMDYLEFYFAYQTNNTWADGQDIKLIGSKNYTMGYTYFNKFYPRSTWAKPPADIYSRTLKGFSIPYNTPIETQAAIKNNLEKINYPGELADLRAFASSINLQEKFKELKWKTILLPGNKRLNLQSDGSYK